QVRKEHRIAGATLEHAIEEHRGLLDVSEGRAETDRGGPGDELLARQARVRKRELRGGERQQRGAIDAASLRGECEASCLQASDLGHQQSGRADTAGWPAAATACGQRFPERLDADAERAHHAYARDRDGVAHPPRPSTSVTLCPPNPYDDVAATSHAWRRPATGTRSRSLHAGSSARSVAVGGRKPPSSAS